MQFLGIDLGSSSIKAALLDGETGRTLATAFSPASELAISAPQPGWAEQDPETWYAHARLAIAQVLAEREARPQDMGGIGISYQMHGLVALGQDDRPVRPAIIWCDSRAVQVGDQALQALGTDYCFDHLLNAPGNFTASKLGWMARYEPEAFERIRSVMLPGDYLAFRLTGEKVTTVSGLSEGMFWDFAENQLAERLLAHFQIPAAWMPERIPVFGEQGQLSAVAAADLGLPPGIPVAYRAGDQPNNAFSLRALHPGELAATAGTSGVVYGVSDLATGDRQGRVNTFAHVNHRPDMPRLGVLLCVNGCGIQYSWAKKHFAPDQTYQGLNQLAATAPVGAGGIRVAPFGNGAERVLGNHFPGGLVAGLDFNRHERSHLFRAIQEGIVFSLVYGLEGMRSLGIEPRVVRAGKANLFLSPLFRQTFATLTGAVVELFETDGATGAARGAGLGIGYYNQEKEAFTGLHKLEEISPRPDDLPALAEAFTDWKSVLEAALSRANP